MRALLDAELAGLVSKKHIHHAIVAVENGDGSFHWVGTSGDANPGGPAMDATTPFFVASVTKLFTATVAMRLYEQGSLRIDEPIATYLPRTMATGLHRLDGRDYTAAITVHNLLNHTSGLPDYFEDRPKGGRSLSERLFSEGDREFTDDEVLDTVRQLTPHFPPQPADAERPRIRYSDTNYRLLGIIITQVTGQPLHRSFEELLLKPFGLHRTYLFGQHEPQQPAPEPATIWFQDQPLHLPRFMASHGAEGGMVSTVEDMTAFMRALFGGKVFDDPATLRRMQERWIRFGFPRDAAAMRAPSWPIEYALGLMRFRLPRLFTPLEPMPAVLGHTGSTGSWMFYCPERDLYLSGTVDQATAGAVPYRFVPRLLRALRE